MDRKLLIGASVLSALAVLLGVVILTKLPSEKVLGFNDGSHWYKGTFDDGIDVGGASSMDTTTFDYSISVTGTSTFTGTQTFTGATTLNGGLTTTDITLTGSVTSTGSKLVLNSFDTRVSYGSWADSTTTLWCVQNPFGVTSTVEARVKQTGASTSSVKLYVAPTSTVYEGLAGLGQLADNMLIEGAAINTNTLNYVASGVTVGSDNIVSSGGGTFQKIMVSKSDYVCGQVVAEASTDGFTNTGNTAAGTYTLIWGQ